MTVYDLFKQQREAEAKKQRRARIRIVLAYVADKWIDFAALILAIIALIRTF